MAKKTATKTKRTPIDIAALLAEARATTDVASMLRALVTVWRAVPDPVLADAIAKVGAVAERGTQLPIDASKEERQETWLRLAADDDPAIRGRLLATLVEGGLRPYPIAPRLAALLRTPDPRTADRIIRALLDDDRSRVFFARDHKPFFVALSKCGDPRIVEYIPAIRDLWKGTLPSSTVEGRGQRARVEELLATALAAHPPPHPALPGETRAIIEAIARSISSEPDGDAAATEAALRAAVYAAPADDGPRQIYADWLQERGDPRGEFIVLQLAPRDRASAQRIHELWLAHYREWLDPAMPPWLDEDRSVDYARGFPSKLAITGDAPPHPMWATLRSVTNAIPASDEHPMPMLREATNLPAAHLARLVALATKPPLECLHLRDAPSTRDLASLRLPHLRELDVEGQGLEPSHAPMLCAIGPIAKLVVTADGSELVRWHAAIAPTTIAELVVRSAADGSFKPAWTRDATGKLSRLDLTSRRIRSSATLEMIAAQLAALPPDHLTELSIAWNSSAFNAAARRSMTAALARHPSVTSPLKAFLGI